MNASPLASLTLPAMALALSLAAPHAAAQDSDPAQRRSELQRQLEAIQAQLKALDDAPATTAPAPAVVTAPEPVAVEHGSVQLAPVVVTAQAEKRAAALALPVGQALTTVERKAFQNAPTATIAEVLALVPGVTTVQGNGPRDVSVSVRGSNSRQTFAIRNIQVFEDGFPVTQPDGTARTDLTDPHAYGSLDVVKGPSSAAYGNYATGGAINFNTRSGRSIQGAEVGLDVGSYGYWNGYALVGEQRRGFEYSGFVSNVRGQSNTAHTDYLTTTANLLATVQLGEVDRLTFKFINNDLDTDLSIRLSLNQYRLNPYQDGCAHLAAAGCASVSVFNNGFNGTRRSLSAEQGGLLRNDRRTILGARWEHDFDDTTRLRTQLVFDNRDIKQPTSATPSVGTFPSFNFSSSLAHDGLLWGRESKASVGLFANTQNGNSTTYNLAPNGGATLGGVTQTVYSRVLNSGLRLREEWAFAPRWTAVAGIGSEYTKLEGLSTAYGYPTNAAPTTTRISGNREFVNVAPELAVQYAATQALTLHARAATGYGTPQVGNLFTTPAGVAGNNTALDAQENLGFDIGADWQYSPALSASLTGFYEFFRNELVTQSPGAGLQNFTFNAPRSEHRGVEVALDWHPLPVALPGAQISAAYLYDDQIYRDYTERLSAGTRSAAFERDGRRIPGIQPQYLNTRLIYEQPTGRLAGLGAYVEFNYRESFYLDNANLLKLPGYSLVNLNLHYNPRPGQGVLSQMSFYVAAQNLFDETYVSSGSNLSNTLNATTGAQNGADALAATGGSIYAGSPRLFYSGVKVRF